MSKSRFALIFTSPPPAVDVVRGDMVMSGTMEPGQKVVFKCWMGKLQKKDVYEEVEGEILEIGKRKDLIRRKIGQDKQAVESSDDALKARRQEIEKERMKQVYSKGNNLQEISAQLLTGGPGSLQPTFTVRAPIHRVPKVMTALEEETLKTEFANLECLRPGPLKVELLKDRGLYGDAIKMASLKTKYGSQPKEFFRKVMKHLVTEELLGKDYISAQGKRGCVAIPNNTQTTVYSYTTAVYRLSGGDPSRADFDAEEQLTNLITNCRRKLKKSLSSGSSVASAQIPSLLPSNAQQNQATSSATLPPAQTPLIATFPSSDIGQPAQTPQTATAAPLDTERPLFSQMITAPQGDLEPRSNPYDQTETLDINDEMVSNARTAQHSGENLLLNSSPDPPPPKYRRVDNGGMLSPFLPPSGAVYTALQPVPAVPPIVQWGLNGP